MKTLSLCVFIDAFGWELAKRHSFLDDLLTVKSPLETILGYSCTCDPTILTGKMPSEHGHFSFFAYAPEKSPFDAGWCRLFAAIPPSLIQRGRIRRMISRLFQKKLAYTGYFQLYNFPFRYLSLFDYTEKRDLYEANGINNGCTTIFDDLRATKIPFVRTNWRRSEAESVAELLQSLKVPESNLPRFAYLYLAEMDALLHAEGTQSPKVAAKIADYDRILRGVLQTAYKRYDKVRLHIFSDHGMTDVTATCALQSRIAPLGLRFGTDYAAVYDSTMARFWFLSDRARTAIPAALAAEKQGRILSDAELDAYGNLFPDSRYGELFFLMNPGVLLCPSFLGETPLAGMHGYAPEHPDSTAFFASTEPEIGTPERLPRRLDDLYSLMRQEAGVSSIGVGTLSAV